MDPKDNLEINLTDTDWRVRPLKAELLTWPDSGDISDFLVQMTLSQDFLDNLYFENLTLSRI